MGLNSDIMKLAVPSILANVTVPLVGIVDMAVAGHLGDTGAASSAALIGGIAIGTMLFDLMYWVFGFLRVGTGGLAAQACGRLDIKEAASILLRALGLALLCALLLVAVQRLFLKGAFLFVDCSAETELLATRYFLIRIWAAPATLSLMAFKGWFIGMQDGLSPMITDITVNAINAFMSIALASGLNWGPLSFEGMGFDGIALGTVIAQYSGLLCALILLWSRYRRTVFGKIRLRDISPVPENGFLSFFGMNLDLIIRSLCLIGIYIGFTVLSARHGDVLLATASLLMKLMMLFSYLIDGFAYAGEALTGKCIGERDPFSLHKTVSCVSMWSLVVTVFSVTVYSAATVPMVRAMTTDPEVIEMSANFAPWLIFMPVFGCMAFTWDGIYIGATQSGPLRNSMLLSMAVFFAAYFIYVAIAGGSSDPVSEGMTALHGLFLGYMAHLLVRAMYLRIGFQRYVLSKASIF